MDQTATQERTARVFEQSAILGDPAAVSLEVNQRLIGELTELSVGAAKDNARLVAELQIAAIDALHESQAAVLRWQAMWPDALTDPMRWHQTTLTECLAGSQRALAFVGTSARVVMQAADRLQASAVDTGRRIRETMAGAPSLRETGRS